MAARKRDSESASAQDAIVAVTAAGFRRSASTRPIWASPELGVMDDALMSDHGALLMGTDLSDFTRPSKRLDVM